MSNPFTRALRAEEVRILWDYQIRLIEMHERRYLQLEAVALTGALATLASVLLERVPPVPGVALALALFAVAAYLHLLIRRLPRHLRDGLSQTVELVEKLIRLEDD